MKSEDRATSKQLETISREGHCLYTGAQTNKKTNKNKQNNHFQ